MMVFKFFHFKFIFTIYISFILTIVFNSHNIDFHYKDSVNFHSFFIFIPLKSLLFKYTRFLSISNFLYLILTFTLNSSIIHLSYALISLFHHLFISFIFLTNLSHFYIHFSYFHLLYFLFPFIHFNCPVFFSHFYSIIFQDIIFQTIIFISLSSIKKFEFLRYVYFGQYLLFFGHW